MGSIAYDKVSSETVTISVPDGYKLLINIPFGTSDAWCVFQRISGEASTSSTTWKVFYRW